MYDNFNLIQSLSKQSYNAVDRWLQFSMICFSLLGASLFFLTLHKKRQHASLKNQLAALQHALDTPIFTTRKQLCTAASTFQRLYTIIRSWTTRISPGDYLTIISASIPPDVMLTKLVLSTDTLRCKGYAHTLPSLLSFIQKLEQSSAFYDVLLQKTSPALMHESQQELVKFTIHGKLT